jgi:hypothetical protein
VVSGGDVEMVDRFCPAGSGLSITTRRGRRSCESAMGMGSHLKGVVRV